MVGAISYCIDGSLASVGSGGMHEDGRREQNEGVGSLYEGRVTCGHFKMEATVLCSIDKFASSTLCTVYSELMKRSLSKSQAN